MHYSGTSLSHGAAPPTGWEYVLVFHAPDISQLADTSIPSLISAARSSTLRKLRDAGFVYSQLWMPSLHVILVRIALPEQTLRERAEDRGIELQLRRRFGGGYLTFQTGRSQCYVNHRRRGYFTPAQRLRITLDVLGSAAEWGAAIDVERLLHEDVLKDAYPVHDRAVRDMLVRHAVYERWWDPFHRVSFTRLKDYLGSRMALYFAFLGLYTRMLIGISVVSLPVYWILNGGVHHVVVSVVRFLYGIGLVCWGAYFLKYWKRRNAILNVKWGSTDFYEESNSEIRPQYVSAPRVGFYSQGGFVGLDDLFEARDGCESDSELEEDGGDTVFGFVRRRFRDDPDFQLDDEDTGVVLPDLPSFPCGDKKEERRRITLSVFITTMFTVAMISLTFLIIYFTADMTEYFGGASWGPAVPGVLLGILIFICDNGWKFVSEKLSKWENHRTIQSYQNSLIVKQFVFQFVSNYSSLFYIAFVKPYTPKDPCQLHPTDGMPDCMLELQTQLGSLVITNATLQQLLELGIPSLIILVRLVKLWWDTRRAGEPASSRLRQRLLRRGIDDGEEGVDDIAESKLDNYENTVEDYGELVIQYDYIALFGLAYPPAAVVCLINNLIEMRSDAFKILVISKRVPADDAADIGKWLNMLKILSVFAVWTNAGLIMFTSNRRTSVISDVSLKEVVIFFVFEHVLFWLKKAIENSVSDIPGRTVRHKARQEYLIYRWFKIGERPHYLQNMAARLGEEGHEQRDQYPDTDLLAALESDKSAA